MSHAPSRPAVATRLEAYRILKRKFVRAAFSGEGARRYGGRWNSAGVAVVYTSSVISLAILEWRAHLSQWPAPASVMIRIEFDAALVWSPTKLPADWKRWPCPKATATVGDNWVRSGRSAVLKLPSAVVPSEFNYLLNPGHADFGKISLGKRQVFKADSRIGPLAFPQEPV
jgi:RES domain-containing protein